MRRRTFISIAAGVGAAGLAAAAADRLLSGTSGYAFADDFDGPAGSAPDPSKWTYDMGGGGWGNNELQVYTSARENSFLDGHGNLVIRATRAVDGSTGQATYRSARLKTLGKFSQYHGTFEARIKLAPEEGAWPAWWMMGANIGQVGWPRCGEVDILENFGDSGDVATSVHTPNGSGVFTKRATTAVDDQWHVWRLQWKPGAAGFTFFKDGVPYSNVAPSHLPDWCFSSGVPMFMLLNLAVGGAAGSPSAASRFPVEMLADYVRVW